MTSISKYFDQAELALAAYADLESNIDPLSELKRKGFADLQARSFLEQWRVVEQYSDPLTGLSATVFEEVSTGERSLAVRGTQLEAGDLLAGGLLALGVSERLNPQFSALEAKLEQWLGEGGPLYGRAFSVSGHSLGGYLAVAVKARHGAQVTEAYLFNAPGSGGLLGTIGELVSGLFGQSAPGENGLWNLKASEGASLIAGLGFQPSAALPVHIEAAPGLGVDNHGIVRLTDALAVQALYAPLAPHLSREELNALVDASGAAVGETLESALDALGRLLLGPQTAKTPVEDREAFHTNLYALQSSAAYRSLIEAPGVQLIPLAGRSAAELQARARADTAEGLAVRYALRALNPFALVGADYTAHNADGALERYDPATGAGALTEQYLEDRASLLERKLWFSAEDRASVDPGIVYDPHHHPFQNEASYYEDIASGYQIEQGGRFANTRHYLFGAEGADALAGAAVEDHLYGGGGEDTLEGAGGRDYLEGNGEDDTLRGGAGDDTLVGGAGEDRLEGGAGFDTYVVGSGGDAILDADGQGVVKDGAGRVIAGAFVKQGEHYVFVADAGITATRNSPLTLSLPGGAAVVIEGFEEGALGISLVETQSFATTGTLLGDLAPLDQDPAEPGVQVGYDALGNVIVDPNTPAPARADTLYDSVGADLIRAGEGDDAVYASRGGEDRIEAGGGRDLVEGGAGRDVLIGGSGADVLTGNADDDLLYGEGETPLAEAYGRGEAQSGTGQQGDWLDGAAGDDALVGEAGEDVLSGGLGGDVLFGGGGADNLWGDLTLTWATRDWTIARAIDVQPDITFYRAVFNGASVSEEAAGGIDALYGGAGDDWLFGGAGDDFIDGGADGDVAFGGQGRDTLLGGLGADVLSGDEADVEVDSTDLAGSAHGADYLDGGAGGDKLQGNGGDDVLFGGTGADELSGDDPKTPGQYHGADYLDGEEDADVLWGNGGDDVLLGGAGNDHLEGDYGELDGQFHGADYLDGGDGDDELIGQGGADTLLGGAGADFLSGDGPGTEPQYEGADGLYGEEGDDELQGGGGDDLLDGGAGADILNGGAGNDHLIGGEGADQLDGGAGDDVLIVDGADAIFDTEGQNTAVFQTTAAGDLTLGLATDASGGQHLSLTDAAGTTVTIANGFLNAVQTFEFAGGVRMDQRALMAAVRVNSGFSISGTAQADIVFGTRLADTLAGGDGADVLEGLGDDDGLVGGAGNDEYRFGRGDGQDTIDNVDPDPGALDTLRLGPGIVTTDVLLTRSADDLLVRLRDASDQVTVRNHFTTAALDRIAFDDGTVWDQAAIASRLTSVLTEGADNFTAAEGADFIQALGGNDTVRGMGGDDVIEGGAGLDSLYGGQGNDVLLGQDGPDNLYGDPGDDILNGGSTDSDYLEGGTGNDTYEYGRGGGQDTVYAYDTGAGAVDRLKFGEGISPSEVALSRNSGDDLIASIRGTTDQVRVRLHFYQEAYALDRIEFANGTVWDQALIRAKVLEPTEGPDRLIGYGTDDVLVGLAGDDYIDGAGGNDVLRAGEGNDNVLGGAGDDTLEGGAGDDTVSGGAGNDTYFYGLGDGADTLNNNDASPDTTDSLRFGAGILPSMVGLTRANTSYQDLRITFAGASGQITIPDYFTTGSTGAVDEIRFADDPATVWTVDAVKARWLTADDNANSLIGYDTPDTIDGLGGDDFIRGLAANDVLGGGAGNDMLRGDTGDDRLDGGEGDDTLYGNAGADTLMGGAGADQLWGEEYSAALEAPGADLLDGGPGRDTLRGVGGNDTYFFGRGYGHDVIDELGGNGTDTLRLNPEIVPADVALYRHGNDLVFAVAGDGAQAWISQYFTLSDKPIERTVFADGTIWDGAAIAARVVAGTQNAMTGTAGDDTFLVDHVGDTITEGAGQGADTVESWVSYTLPANVEHLTLTGVLDADATGNALANTLTGNAGENRLSGGGGADTLIGGRGDDTYVVTPGDGADAVIEAAGEGLDTVIADLSYALPDNVENLTIQSGYISAITATGNALDNVLQGRAGWLGDVFDGGPGADTMIAAGGTFYVDNPGDRVITTSGISTSVVSAIDWTLAADHKKLELRAGTAAVEGTGNAAHNDLGGNENANTLRGLDGDDLLFGGGSADTLIGGRGDDTYVLADFRTLQGGQYVYGNDSSASVNEDTIVELAGEGVDTVRSLFDYTLGEHVENLQLLSYTAGLAPIHALSGTGNALDNRIEGNAANNVIDGREGADTMIGGAGSDTYYVDNRDDSVVEYAGEGTADTVVSQVSYALGAEVENLTLVGPDASSGTGNGLANRLDGTQSVAANALAGGLGDDTYVLGPGDAVVENPGEGVDTVITEESYTLSGEIENLVLAGTAATSGTGSAGDNVLDGSQNGAANTLIGGSGNDTYVVDAADAVVESPGGGIDTVVANADHALGSYLENLTLIGPATRGTGNDEANIITGNGFDNVLDGAGGADILRGGYGSDTYVIDDPADVVDETDPYWGGDAGGYDTVLSAISYALGDRLESLVLLGASSISGTGNSFANALDGSQNSAANVLAGGAGDDTYVVDGSDVVVENPGEGVDTVHSAESHVLAAEVENLVLVGDGAVNGTGNGLANGLTGNGAANTLDGGAGADFMTGGAGDDTYVVDNAGDSVTENANEGVDTVRSSITYTLPANVENLALTGAAAVNGTGNGLDNVLRGNSAANTLKGGAGNDAYFVSAGDVVSENSGQGTDTVYADVSWTLGSNLENLTLIGSADINATGNGLANVLVGNGGNNLLSGGSGADQMAGGAGNDTYVVDNTGDTVTESANEGIDTVQSSITYTLGNHLENLRLTGSSGISGTGNALDNTLIGNSANNTLNGGAGDDWLDGGGGSDTMRGGAGNDTYVVAQSGDIATENANEGIDTVRSSLSHTLGSNVENLVLTGTNAINGSGNALDNSLLGNTANNVLTGNGGADTLDGGAGTDTLTGGGGNDTYLLGRGHGADTVVENDAGSGNLDIARFLAGVAHDQVWFLRSGNNLETSIIGTGDKFVIRDWYLGGQYRVEQFNTTDENKILLESDVQNLVDAMAAFAPPPMGQTTLPPDYRQALDSVIAANWQ